MSAPAATDYRYRWSYDLLRAIGNVTPDPRVVRWVRGWTFAETGNPATGASFNLLNTTEHNTPGVVSNFNDVGVVNYDSYAHGIQANAKVLNNGLYSGLVNALRFNDVQALGISTGMPSSGVIAGLHTWSGGAGSGYVKNILNNMGVAFQTGGPPTTPPAGGGAGPMIRTSTPMTPKTSAPTSSGSGGGGFGPGNGYNICSLPGAWLYDPLCIGESAGQVIQQAPQAVSQGAQQAISQGIADALTSALKSVGNAFIHAVGAKNATDLEQRAALIGGGIILFFIGIGVLFWTHKDQIVEAGTAAAAPEAEPEVEAAEESKKAAKKPKQGFKRGKKEEEAPASEEEG